MNQVKGQSIQGHILRRYSIIKKVGSGAYGHVWKVEEKITKKTYALKKIFDAFQHGTDAQRTYREIEILKQTKHPNIIKLYETIKAQNNKDVYLVFEYMEADLHNVIAQGILKQIHFRFIVYQLAKALKYLHSGLIIHRDLKPSNILINSNCSIKICDFGLVRSISIEDDTSPKLTQGVATRWYRAPEVLLGSRCYSTPADVWSFGCIIYEAMAQKPLFAGNSVTDQIQKIISYSGYPSEEDIAGLQAQSAKNMINQVKITSYSVNNKNMFKDFSPMFTDLLKKMLEFNPKKRIKIDQILNHQVVLPFKKPEQQIETKEIIRTSISDNVKLSVQQYRNLVYGVKRVYQEPKKQSYSSHLHSGPKKSSSFTRFTYNSSSLHQEQIQKQKKELQKHKLKYVRSSKNLTRPSHPYMNYSFSNTYTPTNTQTQNDSTKNPPRIAYISPKNLVVSKNQPIKIGFTGVSSYNSPKYCSSIYSKQTQGKPLFKSSKYSAHNTQSSEDK